MTEVPLYWKKLKVEEGVLDPFLEEHCSPEEAFSKVEYLDCDQWEEPRIVPKVHLVGLLFRVLQHDQLLLAPQSPEVDRKMTRTAAVIDPHHQTLVVHTDRPFLISHDPPVRAVLA